MGLQLDATMLSKLAKFVALVLKYRRGASLTSLKSASAIIEQLLVDSLAVSMVEGVDEARWCADIGAGGGFPSVAVAIVLPRTGWVAVDSSPSKVAFLKKMSREIGLSNYSPVCASFLEFASSREPSGEFELVVMRGLKLNRRLLRAVRSVLSDSGQVVLYQHTERYSQLDIYGQLAHGAAQMRETVLEEGVRSLRFEYHRFDELAERLIC
ncbi:MAG TPA: RsmG family class I SAM-dependent methyltransferase [bacterium]|nr:RsmG family class I SAM-dependent methyltransferase [bacterium]